MPGATDTPAKAPRGLFLLEIFYLAILLGAFVVFETSSGVRDALPDHLGPLPVEVPWFGALGGALISLSGISRHSCNWSDCYNYWHYSRPLVGAVIGSLGALVIFVLTAIASADPPDLDVTAFDVIAFLVGYREASFRELIKRATDLLLKPGDPPPTSTATVQRAASTVLDPTPVPTPAEPPPEIDAANRQEAATERDKTQ